MITKLSPDSCKTIVGVERDGPDGLIAPIHGSARDCGFWHRPRYSDIDAGAMAAASIDEAVRNAVCVGVDIDKIAGLDNIVIQSNQNPRWKIQVSTISSC